MAKLINLTQNSKSYGKDHELSPDVNYIGRTPPPGGILLEQDFPVNNFSIIGRSSRIHAVVFCHQGDYYLGDCSVYGTWYPVEESGIFVSIENKLKNMIDTDTFKRNKTGLDNMVDFIQHISNLKNQRKLDYRELDREYLNQMLKDNEIKNDFIGNGIAKLLEHGRIIGIMPNYRFKFEA
ncbi:hypothetical protein HYV49_00910 [Candidatus Pacearchaeota archaeon]|nr:hypothetical protein [Candidatus Pacearchaeota archaeon]